MENINSKFPFLTIVEYGGVEYIGIIGNTDKVMTSMYIFNDLKTDNLKRHFLDCGEEWWWETNRQIPINIVLREKWACFRPYLKSFATKELTIKSGPLVSIEDLGSKRSKRRQVTQVRNLD